ncbi:MAG: glycosyltransferase family 4 protein [Sulfurimonas sp.]|nr:glycosyltransferase family 4 protein [Sulfurimonas sp.]
MKKVAYIGHSFHQKTLSTEFFINILKTKYHVDCYWTLPSSYQADLIVFDLNEKNYESLVFFQVLPKVEELEKLLCKNIILVPMFDNDLTMTYAQWSEYFNYKFINFSKNLYDKFKFFGFKKNVYLQYAPEVPALDLKNAKVEKAKIFFWQRSTQINWKLLKNIIDFSQVESVHLHRVENEAAKDTWFEMPSEEDRKKYNVTLSSWFDTKDELLNIMNECDVFIAPRSFEGIGQTFLEAMALGKCVISPNFPTMNEYINNGINGILFDFLNPQPIDLSGWKQMGNEAYKSINSIRKVWESTSHAILDIIEDKNHDPIPYNQYLDKMEIIFDTKESKFIIQDMKISFFNVNPSKSLNFSKYLNILFDYFSMNIDQSKKYIIYGTGTGAYLVSSVIGIEYIECFVDIDVRKHGEQFHGKIIRGLDALSLNDTKIILTVFGRNHKILQDLSENYGIKKERLIDLDFN